MGHHDAELTVNDDGSELAAESPPDDGSPGGGQGANRKGVAARGYLARRAGPDLGDFVIGSFVTVPQPTDPRAGAATAAEQSAAAQDERGKGFGLAGGAFMRFSSASTWASST